MHIIAISGEMNLWTTPCLKELGKAVIENMNQGEILILNAVPGEYLVDGNEKSFISKGIEYADYNALCLYTLFYRLLANKFEHPQIASLAKKDSYWHKILKISGHARMFPCAESIEELKEML
jgi:hypothetical protein